MAEQPELLRIISITPAADFLQTDEISTLPERYSLLLGMPRPLTGYELDEPTAETSMSFVDSGDLRWLGLTGTTLDEFTERRHEIQQILDEVVPKPLCFSRPREASQHHTAAPRTNLWVESSVATRQTVPCGE